MSSRSGDCVRQRSNPNRSGHLLRDSRRVVFWGVVLAVVLALMYFCGGQTLYREWQMQRDAIALAHFLEVNPDTVVPLRWRVHLLLDALKGDAVAAIAADRSGRPVFVYMTEHCVEAHHDIPDGDDASQQFVDAARSLVVRWMRVPGDSLRLLQFERAGAGGRIQVDFSTDALPDPVRVAYAPPLRRFTLITVGEGEQGEIEPGLRPADTSVRD